MSVLQGAVELQEWGVRGDGERLSMQDFPFEKKWGSPITQDTTCLMTALSHYGLLMWLSVGKLPSLPPSWWISPWLPNVENGKGSFLLNFPATGKKSNKKTNSYDLRRLFCTQFYSHSAHIYLPEYSSPWPLYQNFSWLISDGGIFKTLFNCHLRSCLSRNKSGW